MAKTLVGALRVTLGLDSAEFAAGAAKAQGISARLGNSMKAIGVAAAGVGTGMMVAIRRTLNAADDMGKAAQKFGVPVEQLSRLKYAADLSDVSLETLGTGLSQLSKKMVAAAGGGKQQTAMFEKLGIKVVDATGKLRDTEAVLQDVAGIFETMEDGPAKTALAMELFGKSGAQLIPLLNSGKTGLQQMADEANKFGIVIDEKTSKSAESFNDNLTRIQAALGGLAVQLTAAVAPSMAAASEWVIEMVKSFRELSPEIQSIIGWIAGLTATLAPVIVGLGFFFSSMGTLLTPIRLLIPALGLVAAAVGALLSPIGLTVAAIGLLAAGIYAMLPTMEEWRKFWADVGIIIDYVGQRISEFISGAIEGLKTAFTDLWTSATEVWEGIKTSIGGAIDWIIARWDEFVGKLQAAIQVARDVGTAISEVLTMGQGTAAGVALGDGLAAGILNGRSGATAAGASLGQAAAEGLRSFLGINSPSRLAAGFGLNVAEGLAQGMNSGKDLVAQAATGMGDVAAGAMKTVGDLGSRIGDMFATAATNVLTGVESLREAASKLIGQVAQLFINSAMKSIFGNIFDGLNLGGVPGYATGTMNAAAGWAIVGEQGPELVNMRGGERVYDARQTDRMMNGGAEAGGQPQQLVTQVYLDGELILNQIDTPQGEAVIARVNRRLGR